ncbi:hypothetical protein [Niveibacterium sp.]|uniref:tetratricopeptide repeat protein n=1 Tax=Niveibacterium sp. TaxID=2017444 RepID=UPI0035AFA2AD
MQAIVAVVLGLLGNAAYAQVIDRIDINRDGTEAETVIRFTSRIQYIRHAPPSTGQVLRVYIRLINPSMDEADMVPETIQSPNTDMVPSFSVTYPEVSGSILISYPKPMTYTVRQGVDGRSIVIRTPLESGAHDFEVSVTPPPAQTKKANASGASPASGSSKATAGASAAMIASATETKPNPPAIAAGPSPKPETAAPQAANAPVPALDSTPQEAPSMAAQPSQTADISSAEPAQVSLQDIETLAQEQFAKAQGAIVNKQWPVAVAALNRVLSLPANKHTEESQAQIGNVREQSGDPGKARAEYQLYLKLYPQGPHAAEVQARLAALSTNAPATTGRAAAGVGVAATAATAGGASPATTETPPSTPQTRSTTRPPRPTEWTTSASLAQSWYRGKSHIETITPPPPGELTFAKDTLSLVDQDSLITNASFSTRRRDETSDTRFVLRDTNQRNFLQSSKSYNRLYAAYAERTDRQAGYFVRAGRQTATGGGVLERFDGLLAGYNLNKSLRVDGVAGSTVEYYVPYRKSFAGINVSLLSDQGRPSVNGYFIRQMLDGAVNRQAVGTELRYFDEHTNVYGTVDYDIAFNKLNIAMLQANYQGESGNSLYLIADRRQSPPLGLTNALMGDPTSTVGSLVEQFGEDEVRRQAAALTAVSNMLSVGLTRQITDRWQLGGDYRLASIGPTEGSGMIPAQPGTGNNHVFTVQLIGSNLWFENAVGVVNTSYILAPSFDGVAVNLNYVVPFGETWRFDGSLRYYGQKDDSGERQRRVAPVLKASYRWKNSLSTWNDYVSLEAEGGLERVHTDGPLRTDDSNRYYFFVGYRWDL